MICSSKDLQVLLGWGPAEFWSWWWLRQVVSSKAWIEPRAAGLAGLFSWVVAAFADRDLFFQDLQVLLGCPCRVWPSWWLRQVVSSKAWIKPRSAGLAGSVLVGRGRFRRS